MAFIKQKTVVEMGAEGVVGPAVTPPLEPQKYEETDQAGLNAQIAQDLRETLKSRPVRVEKVVGRASMLDPSFHNKGVDYRVGGALDNHWVRNDESHLSKARAKGWVFPETISPRLKNLTHNELVLMVRLQEQSDNNEKYLEAEARNFERKDFDKTPGIGDGLSEFSVTRPSKRSV